MKKRWIIIADRIEARIFRETPFTLIKTLANPLGREKNKVLRTDKPGWGKAQYSRSAGIHSMSGEKDPHEEAAVQFARTLSRFLERESEADRYDDLMIVAEPKMLGRIRSFLAPHLSERVHWMKKDLGHLSDYQIGKKLEMPSERKFR